MRNIERGDCFTCYCGNDEWMIIPNEGDEQHNQLVCTKCKSTYRNRLVLCQEFNDTRQEHYLKLTEGVREEWQKRQQNLKQK